MIILKILKIPATQFVCLKLLNIPIHPSHLGWVGAPRSGSGPPGVGWGPQGWGVWAEFGGLMLENIGPAAGAIRKSNSTNIAPPGSTLLDVSFFEINNVCIVT